MAAVIVNQLQVKLRASNRPGCHIAVFHRQSSLIEQSLRSIAGRHIQNNHLHRVGYCFHENCSSTAGHVHTKVSQQSFIMSVTVFLVIFKIYFLSAIFNPVEHFV